MNEQQASYSESYKQSGVDITAGYEAVRLMKSHVARTFTSGVCEDIGGFGGIFDPQAGAYEHPMLVSGTDGVGTKLKLAFMLDKHDTVGLDCVAMCVNDIICCGAKPMFFLDYIALGKNVPEKVASIVKGVADGCVQAGCSLIGGETAEMPGFYPVEEYDLAGFSVGIVDKAKILDKETIQPGDVMLALPSSGVHSNGFSLVRKVFDLEHHEERLHQYSEELGAPLGQVLLEPTRIYVQPVLALLQEVPVRSVSHITGGGFYENIPRALPQGMGITVHKEDIKTPPIFSLIQRLGGISDHDMFNTFNMGVGMCVTVPAEFEELALHILAKQGIAAYRMATITPCTIPVTIV